MSFASATSFGAEAHRQGMNPAATWSTGIKQAVGTAYESYDSNLKFSSASSTAPISKVWFTVGQGILTETFWPTLDTAQMKDNQLLVTDGSSFFFEERKDSKTTVEWLRPGVPAFRVTTQDPRGRFEIVKTLFTDPDSDVLIQRVKISRKVPHLRFHVLHKPAVENTPLGDSARVSTLTRPGLFAWQSQHAQAVLFSVPMKQASAGFAGSASDGWLDLRNDFRMDTKFETATNGNVMMTAWLDLPETVGTSEYDMVIGFGGSADQAYETAARTLNRLQKGDRLLETYVSQWERYQETVRDLSMVSGDGGKVFRASVALLKSTEDKTYPGAFIASASVPWGNHEYDGNAMPISERRDDNQTAGYHAVWPRDLFHMATSFMALEEYSSAVAALNYLRQIQYRNSGMLWEYDFRKHSRDGSWPQSIWVDGSNRWGGLQLDETAMPLMLAYRLWKAGKIDVSQYWEMVRLGADFIADFGPWSAMERWEEAMGASPSNLASMIAALWTSAEIAEKMGDGASARKWRQTGDAWSMKPGDNLDTWLFTTTGKHGNGRYFERVEGAADHKQIWNPNDDVQFSVANGGGMWREKDVTDGGFLELVRYGVRGALNENILESIPEYDATIRYDLPGIGPGFMRYLGDRYNYSDSTGEQTDGMLWPLLTGERAHYELARAIEQGLSSKQVNRVVDPFIRTMERFAGPEGYIPEQVWREGPGMGTSTGSATPLGWSHAEYLKLLRSRLDHRVFDQISLVSARRQSLDVMLERLGPEAAKEFFAAPGR